MSHQSGNRLPLLKYGAKRTRTANPLHAMEVRYQLRYSPLNLSPILHQRRHYFNLLSLNSIGAIASNHRQTCI